MCGFKSRPGHHSKSLRYRRLTYPWAGGELGSVYHAGGYSGHGVAPEGPRRPFFYNRKPVWLAAGPVRYVGLQAYRHAPRLERA